MPARQGTSGPSVNWTLLPQKIPAKGTFKKCALMEEQQPHLQRDKRNSMQS
jgi:hypothetical protein